MARSEASRHSHMGQGTLGLPQQTEEHYFTVHCTLEASPSQFLNPNIPHNFSSQFLPHIIDKIYQIVVQLIVHQIVY